MKILIAGKGGTGKTSVAAALSIILSSKGYKVIALDTDSTPNLAQSLGIPYDEAVKITPLVKNDELIKERTGVAPGVGWGAIFKLNPRVDDLADKYGIKINDNLKLVIVGSIDSSKQGCLCPAIALAKRFLRYSLKRGEFVIVDAEAGAEVFGRGLAEKFDMMLTISEPTVKSILISMDMIRMATELKITNKILVVNKVTNKDLALTLISKLVKGDISYHLIRFDEELLNIDYMGQGLNRLSENSKFICDVKSLIEKYII